MKNMLKTLLDGGNISVGDIAGVLFDYEEEHGMRTKINIPKATYQESRKRWVINVPAKHSKTGKRYSIVGKTEGEVIDKFKKEILVAEIEPTVENIMKDMMITRMLGVIEPETYDGYLNIYHKYILGSDFGKMRIADVTEDDILVFYAKFNSKNYNRCIQTRIKVLISQTFKKAKSSKLIVDDISENVKYNFRFTKPPKKQKEIFTIEELKKIEDAIVNAWEKYGDNVGAYCCFYSPAYLVMAYTGLRAGEMLGLKESDVDYENNIMYISKQLSKENLYDENGERCGKEFVLKHPKTNESTRTAILPDVAIKWLKELKRRQKVFGIETDYFVISVKGELVNKPAFVDTFKTICKQAQVEYRPTHKLRKTFVSNAINADIPVQEVAESVGHKNITVTLNTYYKTLSDPSTKKKNANIVNNAFCNNDVATGGNSFGNSFRVNDKVLRLREAL